ncbi:MAG: hypothetical protein RL557_105 [archaeon]
MDVEKSLEERKAELEKKYTINFKKLEEEQSKLAKDLVIKDIPDLTHAEKFGAFDVAFIKNKILCCIIVCNKQFEIVDQSYVFEKIRFPYFPGFRNYREIPAMIAAAEKLNERPDVVFFSSQGIMQRLDPASHFGLSSGIPTIGVSDVIVDCEVEGDVTSGADILKQGKSVGKVLMEKIGSKPLYISPGNNISVKTAYRLSKELVQLPHKNPEPLHLASKYASKVKKELLRHEEVK